MVDSKASPFDDASGHEFLKWFESQGGLPSAVYDNVVPAGTTLADATTISLGFTIVRATVSGAGLRLPNAPIGSYLAIINADATNDLKVWPPSASQTLDLSNSVPGASVNLSAGGGLKKFQRLTNTEWVIL